MDAAHACTYRHIFFSLFLPPFFCLFEKNTETHYKKVKFENAGARLPLKRVIVKAKRGAVAIFFAMSAAATVLSSHQLLLDPRRDGHCLYTVLAMAKQVFGPEGALPATVWEMRRDIGAFFQNDQRYSAFFRYLLAVDEQPRLETDSLVLADLASTRTHVGSAVFVAACFIYKLQLNFCVTNDGIPLDLPALLEFMGNIHGDSYPLTPDGRRQLEELTSVFSARAQWADGAMSLLVPTVVLHQSHFCLYVGPGPKSTQVVVYVPECVCVCFCVSVFCFSCCCCCFFFFFCFFFRLTLFVLHKVLFEVDLFNLQPQIQFWAEHFVCRLCGGFASVVTCFLTLYYSL